MKPLPRRKPQLTAPTPRPVPSRPGHASTYASQESFYDGEGSNVSKSKINSDAEMMEEDSDVDGSVSLDGENYVKSKSTTKSQFDQSESDSCMSVDEAPDNTPTETSKLDLSSSHHHKQLDNQVTNSSLMEDSLSSNRSKSLSCDNPINSSESNKVIEKDKKDKMSSKIDESSTKNNNSIPNKDEKSDMESSDGSKSNISLYPSLKNLSPQDKLAVSKKVEDVENKAKTMSNVDMEVRRKEKLKELDREFDRLLNSTKSLPMSLEKTVAQCQNDIKQHALKLMKQTGGERFRSHPSENEAKPVDCDDEIIEKKMGHPPVDERVEKKNKVESKFDKKYSPTKSEDKLDKRNCYSRIEDKRGYYNFDDSPEKNSQLRSEDKCDKKSYSRIDDKILSGKSKSNSVDGKKNSDMKYSSDKLKLKSSDRSSQERNISSGTSLDKRSKHEVHDSENRRTSKSSPKKSKDNSSVRNHDFSNDSFAIEKILLKSHSHSKKSSVNETRHNDSATNDINGAMLSSGLDSDLVVNRKSSSKSSSKNLDCGDRKKIDERSAKEMEKVRTDVKMCNKETCDHKNKCELSKYDIERSFNGVRPTIADVVKVRERRKSLEKDQVLNGSERRKSSLSDYRDDSSSDSESSVDLNDKVDLDTEQTQTFSVSESNFNQVRKTYFL